MTLNPPLEWWPYNIVEKERSIDEQRETSHLQPFECLPPKAKRYDPDEEGAACIDSGARGRRDCSSNGQAEEVESTVNN